MMYVKEFLETSTIHGLSYIASNKKIIKLFWTLTVASGFCSAAILIFQSFQAWEESPITTTIETIPISKIKFPKVSVCPPANTVTNLNYDLMMADNMTLDNNTRKDLIKIVLEHFDNDNFESVLKNLSLIHEKSRFQNWYNGLSKIIIPRFSSGKMNTKIETASTSGVIMTRGFGQNFDQKNVNKEQIIKIIFHSKAKMTKNDRILGKVEYEKLNLNSIYSYEKITLDERWFDKKELTFNFSSKSNFILYHMHKLVDKDWNYLKMEKMPGFRISWRYSNAIIPDRKFFVLDDNQQSTSNLNNNVFNRFVFNCF